MNTFTPTALENGVSLPPRGDRPGGKGEDFAEAFYGAVDGLPPTPAPEPPPRRGPEAIETPEPSNLPEKVEGRAPPASADSRDARVANSSVPMRPQDLGKAPSPVSEGGLEGSATARVAMAKASLEAPEASQASGTLREDREGKAPPVSLGARDARVANSSVPMRPQDLGKAPSPVSEGGLEGSATARVAMAKASLEAPEASQASGTLREDREGKAPPVSLGARDARVANSSAAIRPQDVGKAPSPITSWQGASASVPGAASQKESGVAKADLRKGSLLPGHGLASMEQFTPPRLGEALPLGAAGGKAGAYSKAPLGVSAARQTQAPIGVQALPSLAGRETAGQGIARLSTEVLELRLLGPQPPGDLGSPGFSIPESGQPTATPFTPGLEGRSTATVATLQEARFGPALVRDLQQQFSTLQEGDVRTVELRLDPPELGRVTVRISVVGEEARVVFAAAQGGARELLESTLPRLREMFEEAGLTLGEAAVDSGKRDGSPKRKAPGPLADGMDAHDLESQSLLDRKEGGVNSSALGRLDLHA